MGQEIVYCTGCGLRLRTTDFERGEATRAEGADYCRPCAEQVGIPLSPPAQTSRSSQKSTARIPVVTPSSGGGSSRNTTRRMAAVSSSKGGSSRNSTSRIPIVTPRQGTEAVPASSVSAGLLWGGVALGVAALVLVALVFGGRSAKPAEPESAAVRSSPPPATERGAAPAARDAKPEAAKPAALPGSEPADLAALEKRVAETVGRERFRESFEILESERKRHDSLEWTAAVQRATYGVDAAAKKLYQELQAKAEAARLRGDDAGARSATDRIAAWGLPSYPAIPAPAPAAALPGAVAVEPGAAVPAPNPVAPAPVKATPALFVPGPLKWSILKPLRASATQGVRLTILEDGSLLAEGDTPATDRYAVVVQTDLKDITAVRLEVLTDGSLPASGPGRAFNGNFVLTEFQVQVLPDAQAASGTPVIFERTAAEHGQEGFPIGSAVDGRNDTGWAVLPRVSRSQDAVFETRAPLPSALALLVILDQQSIYPQHQIGRFRLSATTAKGAAAELAARPPPAVEQGTVDAAIRRGLDWLRKGGSPGAELGDKKQIRILNCDELLLLTFLHSGVPENDPRFQQLLASVLTAPYAHTYSVAIRAMALEELDRVRYQLHIARCAQFLLDNQRDSGQWSYGEPSVAVDSIRADVPAATAARPASAATPKTKPKIVQRISVRPTRTTPGNGDFSNSQYAALGLRACIDAGIIVPKEVLVRGMQALTLAQLTPASKEATPSLPSGRKPRGWCYDSPCACPLHRPYGTMTSGAVSALAIYDHLLGRDAKKDAAILDGLAWLQVNYAIDTVPGPIEFDKTSKSTFVPYYLYALERAMILTGNERLGTRLWYADGVRYLLETQKPDGSWQIDDWGRDTWDTCFALLFLKRSTRPLVASTDRFHPPDDEKK